MVLDITTVCHQLLNAATEVCFSMVRQSVLGRLKNAFHSRALYSNNCKLILRVPCLISQGCGTQHQSSISYSTPISDLRPHVQVRSMPWTYIKKKHNPLFSSFQEYPIILIWTLLFFTLKEFRTYLSPPGKPFLILLKCPASNFFIFL